MTTKVYNQATSQWEDVAGLGNAQSANRFDVEFDAGPLSVADATLTTVICDGVNTVPDGYAYNDTTGVLTIENDGWYCFAIFHKWTTNATGSRVVQIAFSAGSHEPDEGMPEIIVPATGLQPSGGNGQTATHFPVMFIAGGSTVAFKVRQTSGGALNLVFFEVGCVRM